MRSLTTRKKKNKLAMGEKQKIKRNTDFFLKLHKI